MKRKIFVTIRMLYYFNPEDKIRIRKDEKCIRTKSWPISLSTSTVRDRHLWIHEIGSNSSTLHLYTLSSRQWPLSSWLYLHPLSRFQHVFAPLFLFFPYFFFKFITLFLAITKMLKTFPDYSWNQSRYLKKKWGFYF